MARYRADYDAAAGLDRFAGWLRTRAPGGATRRAGNGIRTSPRSAGRLRVRRTAGRAAAEPGADAPPGSYGDPVSALYEQHYASLVRLAALLVRDTATAEEIVQDSFVAMAAAWRRRGDIDGALDFLRQSVLDRSRSGCGTRHPGAPERIPGRLAAAAGRPRRAARPAARGTGPALLRQPL